MTTTTIAQCAAAARPVTVTVACLGTPADSAARLRTALSTLRRTDSAGDTVPEPVGWVVDGTPDVLDLAWVDVVVCDAAHLPEARRIWPVASVITIVPAHDDGVAVVAALDAGAETCVRAGDITLIAAYVAAVARRRGLLVDEAGR